MKSLRCHAARRAVLPSIVLVLAALVMSQFVRAQEKPKATGEPASKQDSLIKTSPQEPLVRPPDAQPKPTPPKLPGEIEGPVIVNTDLITVTVTVTDIYGRYVSGLGKNAFNVFDGSRTGKYEDNYYRYLNVGLRLPISTGTDWFIYDFARVYVRMTDKLSIKSWLDFRRLRLNEWRQD